MKNRQVISVAIMLRTEKTQKLGSQNSSKSERLKLKRLDLLTAGNDDIFVLAFSADLTVKNHLKTV